MQRPRTASPSALRRALAVLLATLVAALPAAGAPLGESVVAGEVDVARAGAATTISASDGSIIEWQDFGIAAHESVEFIQPGEWARVLNRVLSPDPTIIAGTLTAPGHVYIAAASGVYYRGEAVVDVGRLVTIGGDIANQDFIAGRDHFELTAPVENAGELRADAVALLGSRVANHGSIVARDGLIVMAAGDSVWIAEHGSPVLIELPATQAETTSDTAAPSGPAGPAVENTGQLDAGRGAVRLAAGDLLSVALRQSSQVRGRTIEIAGGTGGLVDLAGQLDASDGAAGAHGGDITVTGSWIRARDAEIDASGAAGGGRIRIGGDRSGRGELARADVVRIDDQTLMRANARERGDGGEVILWSERATVAHGAIEARGGAAGGDGGFVETSSKGWLETGRAPDASAPAGEAGQWLLDPANLRVVAAAAGAPEDLENLDSAFALLADAFEPRPVIFPVVESSQVSANEIAKALAAGTNVRLTTELFDGIGTDAGNISIEASILPIDANPGTRTSLSFDAANDLTVFPGVEIAASGNLELDVLMAANGLGLLTGVKQAELEGQEDFGLIDLPATAAIRTNGGALVLFAGNASDAQRTAGFEGLNLQGTVDTAGGDLNLSTLGGNIAIGATATNMVTTAGGDITIDSIAIESDDVITGGGIEVEGTLDSAGGQVRVTGLDGNVSLDGIRSGGGDIMIDAAANLGDVGPAIAIAGVVDSAGGDIQVGATEQTAGLTTPAASISIGSTLASAGGSVAIGTSETQVDLAGSFATAGGDATVLASSADLADDFSLDALAAAPESPGSLRVEATDSLTLGDRVSLQGDSIALRAATDGTVASGPALGIGSDVSLQAGSVELRAGDGFSRSGIDDDGEDVANAAIAFGANLAIGFTAAADGLDGPRLTVTQDADLAGPLPRFAAGVPMADHSAVYRSSDGTLTVDDDLGSGLSDLTLAARDGLTLNADQTPESLTIENAESLTVDTALAQRLLPTSALTIRAGLESAAESVAGAGDAIGGDLVVEADLTASEAVHLHGAAGGLGSLTFGSPVTLDATEVSLRAGDGTGLANTAAVDVADLTLGSSVQELSIRQDAAIVSSQKLPIGFDPAAKTFALRSDDGEVQVDAALSADELSFVGQSLRFQDDAGAPVQVTANRFDLGSTGAFTLDAATLAALVPGYTGLTLRSGEGSLSLGIPEVAVDDLTMIVGEGSTTFIAYALAPGSTVFRNSAGTAGPLRFTLAQKSQVNDATIEALLFPDGKPSELRLRADDPFSTDVVLTRLPEALGAGGALEGTQFLTLEGEMVSLEQNDGSLDLATPTNVLIRSEEIELASDGEEGCAASASCPIVDVGSMKVAGIDVFEAAFDPTPFFPAPGMAVPAPNEDVPLALVRVRQEGDLAQSSIPQIIGTRDDVRLVLQSGEGEIDLSGADSLVADTALTLSLDPLDALGEGGPDGRSIEFGSATLRPRSLNINSPFGLTIRSADIDVTPAVAADVDADNFIVIQVGDSGIGDLTIGSLTGPAVQLTASAIELRAGDGSETDEETEPSTERVVFDPGFAITLKPDGDGASALTIIQDASIVDDPAGAGSRNLPAAPTVVGGGRVGLYTLSSQNGDVTLRDIARLAADETQIGADPFDNDSKIVLESTSGDLDITQDVDVDKLMLVAPRVELRAVGNVIAEGPSGSPLEFSTVDELAIVQGAALDPANLPEISRFVFDELQRAAGANGRLEGLDYEIELTDLATGDIALESGLVDKTIGSNLTLTTPGTVRVETAPDLGSLKIAAPDAVLDFGGPEPTIAVDGILEFAGDLMLAGGDSTLQGLDVIFGGAIAEAGSDAGLTVQAERLVGFAGDVGSAAAPLRFLDVQLVEGAQQGPQVQFTGGDRRVDVDRFLHVRAGSVDASGGFLPSGRAATPALATIGADASLTIDARGLDPADAFAINFGPDGAAAGVAEKLSVVGTALLLAGCNGGPCTGRVRVGDVATDRFQVNAAGIDVVRRGDGIVRAPGGGSERDAGVDWVANDYALSDGASAAVPAITQSGSGSPLAIGVPDASELQAFMQPFATATIFPDGRRLAAGDLLETTLDEDSGEILGRSFFDFQPRGGSFADLSQAIDEAQPVPRRPRAPQPRNRADEALGLVGIEARPATAREFTGMLGGAGIYDDASRAWREPATRVVAASRLDVDSALRSVELHREVFGADYAKADSLRTTLGNALRSYRRSTGATRVLGFEFRRWLSNRPASHFEAYQALRELDRLFAAHRRSGLARSEWQRIQSEWLAPIKPDNISLEELAETIHPTRYVRGSDILDIFGN